MRRGAVLIGVANTKGLPSLKDAVGAARRMQAWVQGQDFKPGNVRLITDENEPVTLHKVREAITLFHDADPPLDQLLIYFSGHGINNGGDEVWLLTDGFRHAGEAVNVAESAKLARHGRIHHVVFISDACRTPPVGLNQQLVTGAAAFPIHGSPKEKGVDLFFASALGEAALEIKVPGVYGEPGFAALYTTVLIDALNGGVPSIIETAIQGDAPRHLIRPWPLSRVLGDKVAEYLIEHNLHRGISQTPVARISSDPSQAWLALVPRVEAAGGLLQGIGGQGAALRDLWRAKFRAPLKERARNLPDWVDATLDHLLGLGGAPLQPVAKKMATMIKNQAAERSKPFVLDAAKDRSGLQVRGEKVKQVLGVNGDPLTGAGGQQTFLCDLTEPTRALVVFEDGSGVVVPMLPRRIAVLTFDNGRWSGLAYETPVVDGAESESVKKARYLREFVAATAERGLFQADRETLMALVGKLLEASAPDPVLMLHLAYALDDAGMNEQLLKLRKAQGVPDLFDVALLAGAGNGAEDAPPMALPGMPILARGWSALAAGSKCRSKLLDEVAAKRRPGRWTHFTQDGVESLRGQFQEVSHA